MESLLSMSTGKKLSLVCTQIFQFFSPLIQAWFIIDRFIHQSFNLVWDISKSLETWKKILEKIIFKPLKGNKTDTMLRYLAFIQNVLMFYFTWYDSLKFSKLYKINDPFAFFSRNICDANVFKKPIDSKCLKSEFILKSQHLQKHIHQ